MFLMGMWAIVPNHLGFRAVWLWSREAFLGQWGNFARDSTIDYLPFIRPLGPASGLPFRPSVSFRPGVSSRRPNMAIGPLPLALIPWDSCAKAGSAIAFFNIIYPGDLVPFLYITSTMYRKFT